MPETKARILIIEDEKEIAALEKDFLTINGFTVAIENDGLEGQKHALSGNFSLILLDLNLPGKDGMDICRDIRDKIDIPIIMITARKEDTDKIRGFGFGADDFVVKPFSMIELVARVKSHIARYERLTRNSVQTHIQNEIDFGWLRIDKNTHRVTANENEISLTPKEYELLYFLTSNPDHVFSKEQLYDKIWGEDKFGDLKTVTVFINRLREKIEKNPNDPMHIETIWGTGYRFLK